VAICNGARIEEGEMKFTSAIAVFFLLTLATSSGAQIDPDPDGIGIYFDEAATQTSATADVGEDVVAYLVATHPSQSGGLAMWEAVVSASPYAVVQGGTSLGHNVAANMPGGQTYAFVVFCYSPLPPFQNPMVLATLVVTPADVAPIDLFVGGYDYEIPMYRLEDPLSGEDRFWYPGSGSVDLPVARINGDAPVVVDSTTWSAVKATFR
jgi:hypothetical protein